MSYRNPAQIKSGNVEKMGTELGAIYSALWQDLARAHLHWKEYVELFGTNPERIELLNRAAPRFFRMLQDELWETSLLNLTRLTDRPKTSPKGGRENLTVKALPALIGDSKVKAEVESLVETAEKATQFARDWRNRRIAHSDLKIALEEDTEPLAAASRGQVNSALKALAAVMNAIETHYHDSEVGYDLISNVGGSACLLHVIDDGVAAAEKCAERRKQGDYNPKDFRRKKI